MVRLSQERILLIGDEDRQIYSVLSQALPSAFVRSVSTVFDGIAELSEEKYTAVLAAAEPIERRPEAAVRTLRELSGAGRLLLFGHPTLEPLSQKMLEFGCDDYLITPVTAGELMESLQGDKREAPADEPAASNGAGKSAFDQIDLAEIVLDALLQNPQDATAAVVHQIGQALRPDMSLTMDAPEAAAPAAAEGTIVISHRPAASGGGYGKAIHLALGAQEDRAGAEKFLAKLAEHLLKIQSLGARHASLQRLAITDDLTGIYNGRYFRHFLTRIIEKAREHRFPVTLFLFDIDNFKRYNDQYGHGVGDGILKQTSALMRRCVRDHDLVARISGDEFAVIFWEKEGPRQPREPRIIAAGRTPQEPQQILDRFRRLLATQDFPGLGAAGKGSLTISGGLAVFPWNAQNAQGLIEAADKQLMFGAKRAGRNVVHLVGGETLEEALDKPETRNQKPELNPKPE